MVNKKIKLFLSITIALAIIFSLTYIIMSNHYSKEPNVTTQNIIKEKEGLNDNTKIILFAGDKKEEEYSLSDLKSKLNIKGDLTESELIKLLEKQGYILDGNANNELMFKKDKTKKLEGNKYYIGDKDGYLAIYKTDKDGNLKIESSDDVYSDLKTVDSLGAIDKEKIKNFELKYDTKEEAEEGLSEFLS